MDQDTASTNGRIMSNMSLDVFPNPASTELTITVSEPLDHANYSVYNIHGGLVQEGLFQGERMTVALKGLAPGQYHLRLMRKDEMLVKQFIVE